MAITSVTEVKNKETGTYTPLTRRYRRVFQVVSNDLEETQPTILTATDGVTTMPLVGASHPSDATAVCVGVGPSQAVADNRLLWEVPVDYERSSENTPNEDPLDDDTRVGWGMRFFPEVVIWDKNGTAVVNSAGQPFYEGPVMDEGVVLTLRILRNESSFSATDAHEYANTVNAASCTIAGLHISARQGLCLGITGDRHVRNGTTYWAVSYEFEFKVATWDRDILDVGNFYWDGGKQLPFKDEDEPPKLLGAPQWLNGSGGDGRGQSIPSYLTFYTKYETNFAALDLASV